MRCGSSRPPLKRNPLASNASVRVILDPITAVLGLMIGIPAGLGIAVIAARVRGMRRNAVEGCAHCAGPLYAPGSGVGPSLLEGLLLCAPCAARNASRLHLALGIVAGMTVLAIGSGVVLGFMQGGAWWAAPAVAAAEGAVLFGGTIGWMKYLNRLRAAELATTGEIWPDIQVADSTAAKARLASRVGA